MIRYLRHRWGAEGGYREFLTLATPLILSTAAWSVQHFVDRVFLAWYSTEALAAALPAGMANFVIASLFIGVASYVNTFVAQYVGAKRLERVGPAVWQGAYLAVLSGLVGLGVAWQSGAIFDLIGHDTAIRDEEVVYFRILCYGLFPLILSTTASCFFSGRGKTLTVLAVNASATALNIALDYGLIFGHWGLPAWGIRGAAWATNIAALFSAVLFGVLLLQRRYRDEFDTLGGWRPDRDLFLRLLRFGGPNGLNYMFDMVAFSFFILVVGRKGILELTATNLAFSVNSLAFMPLLGGGIAVSTMVGQRLGRDDPDAAEYCTWSGLHLALLYMGIMALAYLGVPQLFLMPYGLGAGGADLDQAMEIATLLLRIVALYCLFDAFYIIFTAALKGAGDTRFIMYVSLGLSWFVMAIPATVALMYFDAGIYILWSFLCAYVVVAGLVFYLRFRAGHWREMRVIEEAPAIEEEPCSTRESEAEAR
ncbi:MAG TPA: MATE family efflux transporter [Candidatus Latescibacteria bacterium]|nr:MATE family efflux transporter [Candidatus Latescibacterota bacterium]